MFGNVWLSGFTCDECRKNCEHRRRRKPLLVRAHCGRDSAGGRVAELLSGRAGCPLLGVRVVGRI